MGAPQAAPAEADTEALRRVAEEASSLVGTCAAAAITVMTAEDEAVVVSTCPLGQELEEAQWASGEGPGLDAIRQFQVFNIASLLTTTSWPAFRAVAASHGVRSTLSVPIVHRGRVLGALDLYGLDAGVFDGQEQVGLRFATRAAQVLAGTQFGDLGPLPSPAPVASDRTLVH